MTNLRTTEPCTAEELSLAGIRARSVAFNAAFEKGAGYKGYLPQAVDVLLAEIERLNKIVETAQLMRSAAVSYAGDTGHQVEGSWLWEKILDFEQACLQSEPETPK